MLSSGSSLYHLHLFEKILFVMKEEQLGVDDLTQWPQLISLPFFEVLRFTRLYLKDIQTVQWPESLYKLIHREDIINNMRLQD